MTRSININVVPRAFRPCFGPRRNTGETPVLHGSHGSVLVIVVAILTLIALMGTAYIAVARLDRYAAVSSVQAVQGDALHQQLIQQATDMVTQVVTYDDDDTANFNLTLAITGTGVHNNNTANFASITHPIAQPWLADRLPREDNWKYVGTNNPPIGASATPIWRFITGQLNSSITAQQYTSPLVNNAVLFNGSYINYLTPTGFGTPFNRKNYAFQPTWISITYPTSYPDRPDLQGKTRTFPAGFFVDAENPPGVPSPPGIPFANRRASSPAFLAADADGDGIADSVLFQITPAPIDGVTYYAAVRIIDNNSAINVNTARLRRTTDGPPIFATAVTPTATNQSFFTSSVGLYELLDQANNNPVNNARRYAYDELQAIDQYRAGYVDFYTDPFQSGTPKPIVMSADTSTNPPTFWPVNDPVDPTNNSNNPVYKNPTRRIVAGSNPQAPDFQFSNQNEAFYMQVGRRVTNPGYNYDPVNSGNQPFLYKSFTTEDSARLAYKSGMVLPTESVAYDIANNRPFSPMLNPPPADNFLSEVDRRLWHSAVASSPNFTWDPAKRWTTFPADRLQYWFLGLNYDQGQLYQYFTPMDGQTVSNALLNVNPPRFRSVRPILTAYNPVSNLFTPKTNSNPTVAWGLGLADDSVLLNPGMIPNDIGTYFPSSPPWSTVYPGDPVRKNPNYPKRKGVIPGNPPTFGWYWNANETYYLYDVAYDFNTQLSYIYINPAAGNAPLTDPNFWEPQAKVSGNSKTNVNVASFPELWRAFMQAMSAPGPGGTAPPLPAGTVSGNPYDFANNAALMFRSPVRAPTNTPILNAAQVLALRSALAAVNTVALRTPDLSNLPVAPNPAPPVRRIPICLSGVQQYTATVFGLRRQPFITEVYANNDPYYHDADINSAQGPQNPGGYFAVELYNPYSVPLDLTNVYFATIDRTPAQFGMQPTITLISNTSLGASLPGGIPGNGYVIIDNERRNSGSTDPLDAQHTPGVLAPGITDASTGVIYQPLQRIMYDTTGNSIPARELILVRQFPSINSGVVPNPVLMPLDSYDFTNFPAVPTPAAINTSVTPNKVTVMEWHYSRDSSRPWHFVFPGRYDATVAAGLPRQVNTQTDPFTHDTDSVDAADQFPWVAGAPTPGMTFGAADGGAAFTWNPFPIQLNSIGGTLPNVHGMPGPNPTMDTGGGNQLTNNHYPFGGFARNGDILQVPFIGSYTIQDMAGNFIEMNAVTMDAAFADDTDGGGDDVAEQVGRFCPLATVPAFGGGTDFYAWAAQLLNYLTVTSPAQDYLPETNPATYPHPDLQASPPQTNPPNNPDPTAVQNVASAAVGQSSLNGNQTNDDTIGLQGLININTAPPATLRMLPIKPDGLGGVDNMNAPTNDSLAITLAQYRDGAMPHPYLTTMVSAGPGAFQSAALPTLASGDYIDHTGGALLPGSSGIAGDAADFETVFLTSNRLSNMITTRSDTFTCYILIQGWRNAGTPYPALEWEKRTAFIIDRSMRKGPNDTTPLKIIPVPTD